MSLHDLWSGKRTGAGKRWQVRYREAGRQHKRNFDTKEAALTFEARRRLEPEQRLAREGRALTVSQMMETWLATKADKAHKTQEAYAYDARQVTAEFGDRLATSVRPSEIRVEPASSRSDARATEQPLSNQVQHGPLVDFEERRQSTSA